MLPAAESVSLGDGIFLFIISVFFGISASCADDAGGACRKADSPVLLLYGSKIYRDPDLETAALPVGRVFSTTLIRSPTRRRGTGLLVLDQRQRRRGWLGTPNWSYKAPEERRRQSSSIEVAASTLSAERTKGVHPLSRAAGPYARKRSSVKR